MSRIWSGRGRRQDIFDALAGTESNDTRSIDSTSIKVQRFTLTAGNISDITAAYELAAKLPSNGCLISDMGYDATKLRVDLAFREVQPSFRPIPPASTNGTSPTRPTKTAILSSGRGVGSEISAV
jgi:hypothetical protein